MTCKTTADFRKEAQECEVRCEFGRAADLWQAAMDNYPRPITGGLAKLDIAKMEKRMQSCLKILFSPMTRASLTAWRERLQEGKRR